MKIKEITSEHILFNNGTQIESYHDQDCCEHVYADFEQLLTTTIMDEEFTNEDLQQIRPIEDAGLKLKTYLIPCYNEQNGYYSSDLTLIVRYPDGTETKTDISKSVMDRID